MPYLQGNQQFLTSNCKRFGFNALNTILLNIPFSALQVVITLCSAWVSQRVKLKFPVVFALAATSVTGGSALYVLGRGPELRGQLLGCYYVFCII